MTSASPSAVSTPRTSVDQDRRRTSIAWTKLPEVPASEARRQSSAATSASAPGTPAFAPVPSSSGGSIRTGRSLSSPPPPPSFLKRVSFDTFDNKDATDFSLTLKSKHRDYTYTRRSRTFLCGTDQNDYSEFALEWLIDELVDDGDEIVCLRVVDKDSKISSDAALQERQYRQEARKLLDQIIEKNEEEKAISIILEFAVGKVHETIQRMIHIYEPVILIVGTRGRSLGGLQGLLPGSVSKYCLQHSPVPVIVVRPSSKRDKKKAKRRADPTRKVYQEILQQAPGLMLHDNDSLSGITEGISNASISTLGEPSSVGGASDGVSPKSAGVDVPGSPSPETLTPAPNSAPDSPVSTRNLSTTELNSGPAESRWASAENAPNAERSTA
ncbi:hypothetical protein FN846DRAFT_980296 [Sphaerosporella brunnea]|uniref:UspA domain-containing protein n=1 Tax=Sphaerosporella brunnea TaxID=1250544 RepID=A0A5J5ED18_9PEZI|nr:hypothetical protein FN846DRAFT_980296 [Sphaerosporella brunnea]